MIPSTLYCAQSAIFLFLSFSFTHIHTRWFHATQARHSYTVDDVEWHKTFVPCVREEESDGATLVDFGLVHELRDAPRDAPLAGAVCSSL